MRQLGRCFRRAVVKITLPYTVLVPVALGCAATASGLQATSSDGQDPIGIREKARGLTPGILQGEYVINGTFSRKRPSEEELMIAATTVYELWRMRTGSVDAVMTASALKSIARDHPSLVGAQQKVKSQHKLLHLITRGADFQIKGSVKFEGQASAVPIATIVEGGVLYQHVYSAKQERPDSSPGSDLTIWIEEIENPSEYHDPVHIILNVHANRATRILQLAEEQGLLDEQGRDMPQGGGIAAAKQTGEGSDISFDYKYGEGAWMELERMLWKDGLEPANGALQSTGGVSCRLRIEGQNVEWEENWVDGMGSPLVEVKVHWKGGEIVKLERQWWLIGTQVVYQRTIVDALKKWEPQDVHWDAFDPSTATQVYDLRGQGEGD